MIIMVTGSMYSGTNEVAEDLEARETITSKHEVIVVNDIWFAKRMTEQIENASEKLIVIHMCMEEEKLAKRIMDEYPAVPTQDAAWIAKDEMITETACNFDETIPDDMMLITYTGESNIPISKFVDICESLINGEPIMEFETRTTLEETDGYKRS